MAFKSKEPSIFDEEIIKEGGEKFYPSPPDNGKIFQ